MCRFANAVLSFYSRHSYHYLPPRHVDLPFGHLLLSHDTGHPQRQIEDGEMLICTVDQPFVNL